MSQTATFSDPSPVASPDGNYEAGVYTLMNGNRGHTQILLSFNTTGSGVAVFPLPYVPVRLRWESNDTLVIAHPKEVSAEDGNPLHRQESISFADPAVMAEFDQLMKSGDMESVSTFVASAPRKVVHVRYETYTGSGEEIERIQHYLQTVPAPSAPKNLLPEGTLGFLSQYEGLYSYSFYETHDANGLTDTLQTRGFQGGGYSWAGIVYGLVKLRMPKHYDSLEFDPEGEGLTVRSPDKDVLVAVAKLVTEARSNHALLKEAIARATMDGAME